MGVDSARRLARDASALVFVRDEAVREIVATALSELSGFMVFQTGSTRDAYVALEHAPDVLVLGPAFCDDEVEELLEALPSDGPAVVLLVTHRFLSSAAANRDDVILIDAPFELDRLTSALEEAVRHDAPSGTVRKHERS